ncbi:MAG: thioesterase family protein [Synechococcaceae cyanobacterium]|nr:thioesterase family protein [Synechococcaceae cyanobacterium]
MKSSSFTQLSRTVRFGDTDAAGVMHFHQLLRWCHEAYEESLERYGVDLATIFPSSDPMPAVALPIVHCSADYRAPLVCGDRLTILVSPERLDPSTFAIHFRFDRGDNTAATALTRHLAIERLSRRRCSLPAPIQRWLEAACLGQGVRPL